MTQTLALAHPDNPRKVRAWCNYKELPAGIFEISCINGAWCGKFNMREGKLDMNNGTTVPTEIVWMGEIPTPHGKDYNTAIPWINEQLQKEV